MHGSLRLVLPPQRRGSSPLAGNAVGIPSSGKHLHVLAELIGVDGVITTFAVSEVSQAAENIPPKSVFS